MEPLPVFRKLRGAGNFLSFPIALRGHGSPQKFFFSQFFRNREEAHYLLHLSRNPLKTLDIPKNKR